MASPLTLEALRRYAVRRTLFRPTTLLAAIRKLGFVQADPIRAPARAQDLILRLRVNNFRAGDLERRYPRLAIEEELFVNYGFVPREHVPLLQPRTPRRAFTATDEKHTQRLLALLRERGPSRAHELADELSLGRRTNAWGGTSNAVTQLMERLHYQGRLRVALRVNGQRVYAAVEPPKSPLSEAERADALIDLLLKKYAPTTFRGLGVLLRTMRYAAPELHANGALKAAVVRARERLPQATVDGSVWCWPQGESPSRVAEGDDGVRLLAPFDPIVWDRERFETFFGFAYRFEAYTPAEKRVRGYYALPMLYRDRVIGWGNLAVVSGVLQAQFGYDAGKPPREALFRRELELELERMREFLALA